MEFTVQSRKLGYDVKDARSRWGNSGTNHYCERYISNYISLHRRYQLKDFLVQPSINLSNYEMITLDIKSNK